MPSLSLRNMLSNGKATTIRDHKDMESVKPADSVSSDVSKHKSSQPRVTSAYSSHIYQLQYRYCTILSY